MCAAILSGGFEEIIGVEMEEEYTRISEARLRFWAGWSERGYDDPESTQLFRSHRVTAVGPMDRPHAGQRLRLAGKWTDHRSHGRQFVFESVEPLSPTDPDGLVKYLASPAFPGVGEKLARRMPGLFFAPSALRGTSP